ncbi:MAG: outer membrane protein assembly factor BamE [Pseudomonadota bacterium]
MDTGETDASSGTMEKRRFVPSVAVLLALAGTMVLVSACGNTVSVRGNYPEAEVVDSITPGIDSRRDVVDRLGSPSTLSTFEDRKWYYVGQVMEQRAFLKPDVVARRVLVVSFDDTGLVEETVSMNLDDGFEVDPVSRVTPTEGREFTIWQQLLGNFNRLPGSVGGDQ